MTIILTLENGNTLTSNVSPSFTQEMINECFVGKDYEGYGVVKSAVKSLSNIY